MRSLILIIIGFLILQNGYCQFNYDFNDNCRKAYSSIISLKFEEGRKLIQKEKTIHPNNNIPWLLDNYIYFLTIFIGEEEKDFEKFDDLKDDIIDRLEEGDESSPYYRYCLAQVNLQWAVTRTKFKEYFTATLEINKAYRYLEKNAKDYPDFLPNLINLGLLHTMIGTIPDNYNWIKKIVSIEGTIDQGIGEVLKVLDASFKQDEYKMYKTECLFYLSFIQINLMSNKRKAFDYIDMIEKDSSYLLNPLAIYAISRIYKENGKNDKAIEILERKPTGKEFYPFYYLEYLTGLAKLHRLDRDASVHFLEYLTNFKGINYIKDSYQKIAWHYLVHGDKSKYYEYIRKVLKYGNTIADADEQAEREAQKGTVPNEKLLKARILFDGGYYERASYELTSLNSMPLLKSSEDSLEYTYRLGRIYHEWGKTDKSITYYKKTIELGNDSEYYYAANAALKLGIIYETTEDYEKAGFYFRKAQSMKNKEYRNSINQKAKAGLQRIENKG